MPECRYKAFISYSHQDEGWARWLQRALESYRVPKGLVGSQGAYGEIPSRLGAVFRDRVDLSSGRDVEGSVRLELEAAETLVVICSPVAAQSPWVNKEIRAFKAQGRPDRIYALIVDGDPQATDPAEQCFPESLIAGEDGTALEPLAADARKWADGKVLAKLKLVAGILGARLDDVRQREMHRRRRNRILYAVTVATVVLLTTILSVTTVTNRKMAKQRLANAEELVGFMLGTLEEISPVSGLDVLDEDQAETIRLTEQLGLDSLSDTELLEQALDWRREGKESWGAGEDELAASVFTNSLAALVNLYQRDTTNSAHLFELGQAEFYVGLTQMNSGELQRAEESFTRYGVIARRLINADPSSADNVLELTYTLTNLASVEMSRSERSQDRVIDLLQAALEYNRLATVLDPNDRVYKEELSQSLAWLSDAWLGVCNLDKAHQYRTESASLAIDMVKQRPNDINLQTYLAYAMTGLAAIQERMGKSDLAIGSIQTAIAVWTESVEEHSSPATVEMHIMELLQWYGYLLLYEGQIVRAEKAIMESANLMPDEQDYFNETSIRRLAYIASTLKSQSVLASKQGRIMEARERNQEAIYFLLSVVSEHPDVAWLVQKLAISLFRFWELNNEMPPADWQALAPDHSLAGTTVRSCEHADLAARQAAMRGDSETAKFYVNYLLNKGYKSAEFIQFCKQYALCD